jgi:alpha-tubulin suppressor-like RCC1 family protein
MDGFNIHSAILTEQGAVWQWGACGHGQYGLGERPWRSLAVQACPAQNVMKVAVNTYTSYILMDDGRVLACGGNWYGQAGTHRKISHYVMNWTETGLNLLDSQWQDPND